MTTSFQRNGSKAVDPSMTLSICLPLCQQYLLSLARLYGIWLGCALCKLAGFNNSVATFVACFVTALI